MALSLKQEASLFLSREVGMAEQTLYLLSQEQDFEPLARLVRTLSTPKCMFDWWVCASQTSGRAGNITPSGAIMHAGWGNLSPHQPSGSLSLRLALDLHSAERVPAVAAGGTSEILPSMSHSGWPKAASSGWERHAFSSQSLQWCQARGSRVNENPVLCDFWLDFDLISAE